MRDLEDEDSYNYGPNEMVELKYNNPRLYDKIMTQNIGSQDEIDTWHRENLNKAKEYLAQQRTR